MAAHPFGPIEKSLIVGYYIRLRGSSPTRRVEIKLLRRTVARIPNKQMFQLVESLKPQFRSVTSGTGPKQGFRVAVDYKMENFVNLLSRGLGYRITFTMTDRNRSEFYPDIDFQILDFYGESVLCEINFRRYQPIDTWSFSLFGQDNLNWLFNFESLEFVITVGKITVIENKGKPKVFCCTDISPNLADWLDAAKSHSKILGELIILSQGINLNNFETKIIQLEGMVTFFSQPHAKSNPQDHMKMHVHFQHCCSVFADHCRWLLAKTGCLEERLPQLTNLLQDVTSWCQGTQTFPDYLTAEFVSTTWIQLNHCLSKDSSLARQLQEEALSQLDTDASRYFSDKPCFLVKSYFVGELLRECEYLKIRECTDSHPSQETYLKTASFILEDTWPLQCRPHSQNQEIGKEEWLELPKALPRTFSICFAKDLLIFHSEAEVKFGFISFDLKDFYTKAVTGSSSMSCQTDIPGMISDGFVKDFWCVDISGTRLVCIGKWKKNPWSLAVHQLDPSMLALGWTCADLVPDQFSLFVCFEHTAIGQASNSPQIFSSSQIQSTDFDLSNDLEDHFRAVASRHTTEYLFVCSTYTAAARKLSVETHQRLQLPSLTSSGMILMVWLLQKTQIPVCCIFQKSGTKLLVIGYSKHQFVWLSQGSVSSCLDLKARGIVHLLPVTTNNKVTDIMAQRKLTVANDGHIEHYFNLVRLKIR